MNTILQKRIEEAARDFNRKEGIPYALTGHVFNAFIEGAAFALQNQWISVDDVLPEYDEKVLVCFKPAFGEEKIFLTTRTENTIVYEKNKFSIQQSGEVIHWMPIPINSVKYKSRMRK